MEEVCEKLDEVALRNVQLINERIRLSLDLQNRLRDGWLLLAKGRYLHGFHSFAASQLDDFHHQAALKAEPEPSGEGRLILGRMLLTPFQNTHIVVT